MRSGVLHHLALVHDRPFRQVGDGADVVGRQAQALEASAVEIAVLVEKRHGRRELVVLDRGQLVARGAVERWRPVLRRGRLVRIALVALQSLEPAAPRLASAVGAQSCACRARHGPFPSLRAQADAVNRAVNLT
jgi:hypothetical protein